MASRRMIKVDICESARFLRLPWSAQVLFFHLILNADDDGVAEGFNVMRLNGCSEDDLNLLEKKGFVRILNDDFVTQIVDWEEHNSIRKDRYQKGIYADLITDDNQLSTNCQPSDNQLSTNCQPSDNQMTAQVRLGKDRLGKDNIKEKNTKKENLNRVVNEYTDNEELRESLKGFIEMRKKEKNSSFTERALKLNLTNLDKVAFDDNTKIEVVNQSIEHGWKTFYALVDNNRRNNNQNSNGFSFMDV